VTFLVLTFAALVLGGIVLAWARWSGMAPPAEPLGKQNAERAQREALLASASQELKAQPTSLEPSEPPRNLSGPQIRRHLKLVK
jgi:hypothetical protein